METVDLAKELLRVERQITKIGNILSKLTERKMEILKELTGK